MMARQTRFLARQRAHFTSAEPSRFAWQTGGPHFAETERALLSRVAGPGRLLEVGCGEGANLFHIGRRAGRAVGVDFSHDKVAFAAAALPWARFACGDAAHLPFADGAFDRVLCRDVLHHLSAPLRAAALREMVRVCRADGEIVIVEPNGRNPLMAALALVVAAERALLQSAPARLATLVRNGGMLPAVDMAQPLPVARVLLHYRFGWPKLGRRRSVCRLLARLDAALTRLVPRACWAYVVVRARPGSGGAS
jgi:SAM-dependent methyltransferase